MKTNKKALLLITSLTMSIGVVGTVLFSNVSKDYSLSKANDIPMRLVFSYENHQLRDSTGWVDPHEVHTERGTTLSICQDGVSYHDNRVYVAKDGLFGNVRATGIEHDPVNGITKLTFTDFNNISVTFGDKTHPECNSATMEPDENGVISFDSDKPCYYKVAPKVDSDPMYFNTFTIDFSCIENPGYNVESKSTSVGQSYYGEDPVSYIYTDYNNDEKSARRPDHFIYIETNKSGAFDPDYQGYKTVAEAIDLHTIVVDVEFKSNVDGQTVYKGIRLDDPYVTHLEVHLDNEDYHDILHPGVESAITFNFVYKDYGIVTAHATAFAYTTKNVTYSFTKADNIKIQDNDIDIPDVNIYMYTSVYLSGYTKSPGRPRSSYTVGITNFTRVVKMSELTEPSFDSHRFTVTGDHEFTFKLDTNAVQKGTYHVYDGEYYQAMVGFNMPTELEVGTDLQNYIESNEIGASFFYYDGEFEYVTFNYSDFDFSKVDINSEGLYFYTVKYKSYTPIKQFINFVLTDIGEGGETDMIYTVDGTDYPEVLGFDESGAYGTLYIEELKTCSIGYKATVHSQYSDHPFYCTGTYERINDNTILLSGQLGGVRVYSSITNKKIYSSSIMYNSLTSTEYTATGYNLLDEDKIYIYDTNYREMMIKFGDYEVRTRFSYLDSEGSKIMFKFPLPLSSSFITLTATIQGSTINVDVPEY